MTSDKKDIDVYAYIYTLTADYAKLKSGPLNTINEFLSHMNIGGVSARAPICYSYYLMTGPMPDDTRKEIYDSILKSVEDSLGEADPRLDLEIKIKPIREILPEATEEDILLLIDSINEAKEIEPNEALLIKRDTVKASPKFDFENLFR